MMVPWYTNYRIINFVPTGSFGVKRALLSSVNCLLKTLHLQAKGNKMIIPDSDISTKPIVPVDKSPIFCILYTGHKR